VRIEHGGTTQPRRFGLIATIDAFGRLEDRERRNTSFLGCSSSHAVRFVRAHRHARDPHLTLGGEHTDQRGDGAVRQSLLLRADDVLQ
jgi:hypothetical protein